MRTRELGRSTVPGECQKEQDLNVSSYLYRIPIFAREGVLRSLLEPFLAFGKAFVPDTDISMDTIINVRCLSVSRVHHLLSNSHDCGLERSLRLNECRCGILWATI